MQNDRTHELDQVLTSHGSAVVLVCTCGWVTAPARRYPAEAALYGHVRRVSVRSLRAVRPGMLALAS